MPARDGDPDEMRSSPKTCRGPKTPGILRRLQDTSPAYLLGLWPVTAVRWATWSLGSLLASYSALPNFPSLTGLWAHFCFSSLAPQLPCPDFILQASPSPRPTISFLLTPTYILPGIQLLVLMDIRNWLPQNTSPGLFLLR